MSNKASLPPGPKGLPIVGNIFQLRRDPLSFMREIQQTHGRMATVQFGKQQVVMFLRPEHVRYVLVEKPRNFVKYDLGNLRFLLGDGLLTSYGRMMAGKRELDTFVYNLIKQRRADGRDVGDVLWMLLQAQDEGNTMTDKQIHDQVFTFIAAGHETARNTMSWTFYLLSQHPHMLE